ncbi:MAG TPA: hypothetical protein VN892_10145 [Solirubrobacteraceae bacterium]|nr:hypothetical protein [Solirubrobacteraceae bacterium]
MPTGSTEVLLPYVTWLSGAPDCVHGQLEVRTFVYAVNGGVATIAPSELVSFTFLVP